MNKKEFKNDKPKIQSNSYKKISELFCVDRIPEDAKNVLENFDKIIQKDRYVKVLFKEEVYETKTLNEIKKDYIELKEIPENSLRAAEYVIEYLRGKL